jgi:TIR domain-containing protein
MTADRHQEALLRRYRIFLSHSGEDNYIVEKVIKPGVLASGAHVFVDIVEIKYGDDFHDRILRELAACDELLVLCTRSALKRPWIFAEIGATLVRGKRVVPVVYGPTDAELQELGILSLLGASNLLKLDDFDEYIAQLTIRVREHLHA